MVSPTCVYWTSNRLVFVMDTGERDCDSSPGPATQSLSLLCRPEEGEEGALVPRHMSALISKSRRSNIIEESSLFGAIVAVAWPSVSSVYPFIFDQRIVVLFNLAAVWFDACSSTWRCFSGLQVPCTIVVVLFLCMCVQHRLLSSVTKPPSKSIEAIATILEDLKGNSLASSGYWT